MENIINNIDRCEKFIRQYLSMTDEIQPEELDEFIKLLKENTIEMRNGNLFNLPMERWITLPGVISMPGILDISTNFNDDENVELINIKIIRGRNVNIDLCKKSFTKEELTFNWTQQVIYEFTPDEVGKNIFAEIRQMREFLLVTKCLDIIKGRYDFIESVKKIQVHENAGKKLIALSYGLVYEGENYSWPETSWDILKGLSNDINIPVNVSFSHDDVVKDFKKLVNFANDADKEGRITLNISVYDFQLINMIGAIIEKKHKFDNIVLCVDDNFLAASSSADKNTEHCLIISSSPNRLSDERIDSLNAAIKAGGKMVKLTNNKHDWTIREGIVEGFEFVTVNMKTFLGFIENIIKSDCNYICVNISNNGKESLLLAIDINSEIVIERKQSMSTMTISLLPFLPAMMTESLISEIEKIAIYLRWLAKQLSDDITKIKDDPQRKTFISMIGQSVYGAVCFDSSVLYNFEISILQTHLKNDQPEIHGIGVFKSERKIISQLGLQTEVPGRVKIRSFFDDDSIHPSLILSDVLFVKDDQADNVEIDNIMAVVFNGKDSLDPSLIRLKSNGLLMKNDKDKPSIISRGKKHKYTTIFDDMLFRIDQMFKD